MKDLQSRVKEKIKEYKLHKRCLALMLALSMFAVFVVPYDENGLPTISMTGKAMSEVQQEDDEPLHLMQIANTELARVATREEEMPNVLKEIPSGAVDFKDKIDGISFENTSGLKIEEGIFDGGSSSGVLGKLKLHYTFATSGGVTIDQRYIYCYLPEGIEVPEDLIGNVKDDGWQTSKGNLNSQVAGYYSIDADKRLLIIKFKEDYVTDKIKNGGFNGSVGFSGSVERDDTAIGDREIVSGNNKLKVKFDDMLDENSKTSQIVNASDGSLAIRYTIVIKNPGKKVNLLNYKLVDAKFKGRVENFYPNNPSIGEVNADGDFIFNGNANNYETISFQYDYIPTAAELASGEIKNQASIVDNRENPDSNDRTDSNENKISIDKNSLKASISKTGTPSYFVDDSRWGEDGELGWIEWTVTVNRDYNGSLAGYTVTDEAFSFEGTKIMSVTSKDGNRVAYEPNGSSITIDESENVDRVTIVYRTYKYRDDNGNLQDLKGKLNLDVGNTAEVTPPPPPGGDNPNEPPPDDSYGFSVSYSEGSSVRKSGEYKTIEGRDKLGELPADSSTTDVKWTVSIVDYGGLGNNKTYVDTLSDTDKQYYTDSQIEGIKESIAAKGLIEGTDYSIEKTVGENGKIVGFKITFLANEPTMQKLEFSYYSTVEVDELQNDNSLTVENEGNYNNNGKPDSGTSTVYRGTPNVGYKSIYASKSWEDNGSSDGRPTVYLMLQYKLEGSTGAWNNYPEIDGNVNPQEPGDWKEWKSVPQKSVNGENYCYRVVEVIPNGSGGYDVKESSDVADGYQVSYTANDASYDYQNGSSSENNFSIKNTRIDFSAYVTKTWVGDKAGTSHNPVTVKLERTTDSNPSDGSAWEPVPGYESFSLRENEMFTLSNLLKKDSEGRPYYYRVREISSINGYTANYEPSYALAQDGLSFAISNIWDLADIAPEKIWTGDDNAGHGSVEVKLQWRHKKNGVWVVDEKENGWWDYPEAAHKTISGSGTADPWVNLPRKDEQGDIYYRAVEVNGAPSGYIEIDDEGGLNVSGTSTIENAWNELCIKPAKQWVGDENNTGDRKSVEFQLMYSTDRNTWYPVEGESTITINKDSGNSTGSKWTVGEDEGWDKLPKARVGSDGRIQYIYYKVVEVGGVDGYTSSDSGDTNESGELTVTNTYDKIEVSATKKWSDETSDERPETIELQLQKFENNKWVDVDSKKMVSIGEGNESAVWGGLPRVDADGATILYRVVESPVKGYSAGYSPATIRGESGTIEITNTKVGEYKKSAISPVINDVGDGKGDSTKEITTLSNSDLAKAPKRNVSIGGDVKSCYLFKWKIDLPSGEDIELIDTLPTGSVFYYDANDKGYRPVAYYSYGSSYEMESYNFTNGTMECEYPYLDDDGKVRFKFFGTKGIGSFTYFIAIPVETVKDAIDAYGFYELGNGVRRTDETEDEVAKLRVGSEADVPSDGKVISKGYVNNDGANEEDAKATYTIEINPERSKLSSEDFLDITDIFEVTGYQTPDGKKVEGTGLIDATVSYVIVQDVDDPSFKMEYSYIPKYNQESTEKGSADYGELAWKENGKRVKKEEIQLRSGDKITFTIKGVPGSSYTKDATWGGVNGEIYYYSGGIWTNPIASEPIPDFTLDETTGTYTLTLTVPSYDGDAVIDTFTFETWDGSFTMDSVTATAETYVTSISSAVLSFQVPDGRHLRITYCYDLKTNANTPGGVAVGEKPPVGSVIYFKNEASMDTSDGTKKDKTDEVELRVSESDANVTTSNFPSIEKVNVGNHSINDLGATFKLAEYDKDNSRWVYATGFTDDNNCYKITFSDSAAEINNCVPSNAADLTISGKHEIDLKQGTLYKLVEVKAPGGYKPSPYEDNEPINSDKMKEFVFYFVYNSSKSEFSNVVNVKNITEISSGGTFSVPNSQLINVSVEKNWGQIPEGANEGDTVISTFKLYYSEVRSSTIPTGNDLKPVYGNGSDTKEIEFIVRNGKLVPNSEKNATNEVKWENLPNGKDGEPIYYYVVEVSYKINGKTYTRTEDKNYVSGNGDIGEYRGVYSGNGLNKTGKVEYNNFKSIYVQKEWENSDGSKMQQKPVESIRFTLKGKTADGVWENIPLTDDERTLDEEHGWKNPIPAKYLEGKDYVDFEVTEELTDELQGYKVSYTKNINGNSGILEITNMNPETVIEKLPIRVIKEWKGNSTHPDEVKVQLYSSTSGSGNWKEVGTPVALNANNSWTHEWKVAKGLYYRVEEVDKINGWTVSYSSEGLELTDGSADNTITVTNTFETGELQVNKKWLGGNDKANVDKIEVEVYQVLVPSANKSQESKTFSSSNGLLSFSRFKRAMAELETVQESEQEISQFEAEEPIQEMAESDGLTLGSLNTGVLAKSEEPCVKLKLDVSANSDPIALPSDLKDKEITSVVAVFDTPNTNGQEFFLNFYDDSEWIGNKYTTINNLPVGEHEYELDTTAYSAYKQVKVAVNYNNSGAVLKELRFYYKSEGSSTTEPEPSSTTTSSSKATTTTTTTTITEPTVTEPTQPEEFTISADKTLLHVGNTANLTASVDGVTWSSSDENVLTVGNNGRVEAKAEGTAFITATRNGMLPQTIKITVASLKIVANNGNVANMTHTANINEVLKVEFVNSIGDVTGNSSDSSIATVDGTTIRIHEQETQENSPVIITFQDEAGDEVTVTIRVKINEEKVEPVIPADAEVVKTLTLTIKESDNWQSEVLNLPITDGKGNDYRYYVKEKESSTEHKYTPISYTHLQGVVLSHIGKTVEEITNRAEEEETMPELPEAGGYGTRPYTVIGVSLMAISIAIWYIRRRMRRIQHKGA